jgi:predicted Fe-Mo cluster-binding NifX family protein
MRIAISVREQEVGVRIHNDFTTVTVNVMNPDLINFNVVHNPVHASEEAGLAPGEIPVELEDEEEDEEEEDGDSE